MRYEITTPSGHSLTVEDDDTGYLETLKDKGYRVSVIHTSDNVCVACEG